MPGFTCGFVLAVLTALEGNDLTVQFLPSQQNLRPSREFRIWVVVKIMVPFGVLIIIRHLLLRVPKKGAIILTATHMSYVYRAARASNQDAGFRA